MSARLTPQEARDVVTGGRTDWIDDWDSMPLADVATAARNGSQDARDALLLASCA